MGNSLRNRMSKSIDVKNMVTSNYVTATLCFNDFRLYDSIGMSLNTADGLRGLISIYIRSDSIRVRNHYNDTEYILSSHVVHPRWNPWSLYYKDILEVFSKEIIRLREQEEIRVIWEKDFFNLVKNIIQ